MQEKFNFKPNYIFRKLCDSCKAPMIVNAQYYNVCPSCFQDWLESLAEEETKWGIIDLIPKTYSERTK